MSERSYLHLFNSRFDMQRAPKPSRLDPDVVSEKPKVKVSYTEKSKSEVSEPRPKLAPRGTIFRAPVGAKK